MKSARFSERKKIVGVKDKISSQHGIFWVRRRPHDLIIGGECWRRPTPYSHAAYEEGDDFTEWKDWFHRATITIRTADCN